MKKCAIAILFLFPFAVSAQIITTFAGGGMSGLGDGGPATAASLPDPIGGAFDKYGNYYCAESLACRIRKVSNSGIITTIAGDGTSGFSGDNGLATAAELYGCNSVKLDTAGNIYICDAGNNRLRKVSAVTGIITTIAGNGIGGLGGDSGLAVSAELNAPNDLCFDTLGNLYIADRGNSRIRKIDASGIITSIAGTTSGYGGDNGPATAAQISGPEGLAIDDTGNLYIAGDNVVRKINTSGIITTVAGVYNMYVYPGDGIPATSAPMYPIKIVIDPFGQLVIADYSNDRVFRVNLEGVIYTIAGNGIAGYSGDNGLADSAEFDYPGGVTYDSCGNLFITDVDGYVRKVAFNPSCWPEKVSNVMTNSISIYPNPVYDEIHIDNVTSPTDYELLNISGIIEQKGILKTGSNRMDIQYLPPGIYLLEMTDEEGIKTIKKVVKE